MRSRARPRSGRRSDADSDHRGHAGADACTHADAGPHARSDRRAGSDADTEPHADPFAVALADAGCPRDTSADAGCAGDPQPDAGRARPLRILCVAQIATPENATDKAVSVNQSNITPFSTAISASDR